MTSIVTANNPNIILEIFLNKISKPSKENTNNAKMMMIQLRLLGFIFNS